MRRVFFCAMVSFLVVGASIAGSEAQAAVRLGLSPSTNPLALTVGQSITFQVQLVGLSPGQELDSLGATINYSGPLLGKPTITTPTRAQGGIVPSPLADPYDFTPSEVIGQADATFMTFSLISADHVNNNGVFFTFQTTALKSGAGLVSLDTAYATQFNPDAPEEPISVTVGKDAALGVIITPEPSTWVLLITAVLAAGAYCLKR